MTSNKQEYKGKNIDEAISAACADFKASQDELDIEVVTVGSAGIFGICKKKAVILVTRKRDSHQLTCEPTPPGEGLPGGKTRHHIKANREQSRTKSTINRDNGPSKSEGGGNPLSAETLQEIKELLVTLLDLMGFPSEISISATGNKVTAHIIDAKNAQEIIGRDGSTLDALQYLLRKIITQKFPEKINLTLDVGTYREDRQKELEALAIEMANKVKSTGKSQIISALNPAERRIVHVTLQDDPGIRSSSLGEGLFKKVKISLPGQGRKRSNSHERRSSSGSENLSS